MLAEICGSLIFATLFWFVVVKLHHQEVPFWGWFLVVCIGTRAAIRVED